MSECAGCIKAAKSTAGLTCSRHPSRVLAPAALERATMKAPRAKKANAQGGSGEVERGTWCTPKWIAEIVGRYDVDAFSNPRSHIDAAHVCMLEDGGDGFGGEPRVRGRYLTGGVHYTADADNKVWFQPPYDIVLDAFAHYEHTRFTALLRFDPSTEWFQRIYRRTRLVCIPRRRRINFEPPPGVTASSSTVPHALYYACEEDATPAVLRKCIAWRP